jgi:hypothetical protein
VPALDVDRRSDEERGDPMTEPDESLDTGPVEPEYGGSADVGVVSSVGEHTSAAGDIIIDLLGAEHGKLQDVLDDRHRPRACGR